MTRRDDPTSLIPPCVWAERIDDLTWQLSLHEFLASLTHDELARVYVTGGIPADLFPPAA